ncbi:MAG: hypothetical protein GW939_01435 [Candidatus Magasanikbacteria bacterium]|uniref:Uncharacterized protein n=1 Tax=Candidatus Magasanikbacteria bacterium CG10_big_fil_rev_8_21_14_0_10_38_6 TaxID=1974647 RepID=A0A2M6P1P4_9BACT|nr:hypothetical protein [Candidatus Magasanikbacteria bacterium]PIR77617.1 MAG: hypothetical protein COU30_01475 [Candidatus Magasanikbacteria bacterium CG10_big_fil_rev_8_21_14_0_10_38_6]
MKKSQQLKNKGIMLNLSKNNTSIKLKSLGGVEIKYVSYGDTEEIAKLLSQKISDKDFVLKVLFRQLVKPEIDFSKFKKIPENELKNLAKAFVKKEQYTFKHFQNTDDFFKDFRQALQTHYDKHIEELRKTFEPILESTKKTLQAFEKNYSSIFKQAVEASSYIQDTMQQFNSIAQQFQKTQLQITESIKPIIKQYSATARIIEESIKPQIEIWQKWAEQNKSVFENFKNLALDQNKKEFLLQNGWVFSPYLSNKTITDELNSDDIFKKKNSEINTIYENFFSENNYSELESMIESWKKKSHFKKRINIFKDCLVILQSFRPNKHNKSINPARTILPLLIAQVDGITSEYAKSKGLSLNGTQWIDSSGNTVKKFDSIWNQPCGDSAEIFAIRMLEDYLFSQAFPYGQTNPAQKKENPQKVKYRPFFQFSRHKIMHGEDLQFGTIDNVIRVFLLLDFLANLK